MGDQRDHRPKFPVKEPSTIVRIFLIGALIPTILFLIPAGMLLGTALEGGQFPVKGMLCGALGGIAAMVWATSFTVIAWQHQKWLQIKIALVMFLIIEFWWLPLACFQNASAHPAP